MSAAEAEVVGLLAETAEELFGRHSDADTLRALQPGGWSPRLWEIAAAAELPLLGVPPEHGGAGGEVEHWATVIRIAARHAAPIPLLETSVAGRLLAGAGIDVPEGPLTVIRVTAEPGERATAVGVPYARQAGHLAVLVEAGDAAGVAVVAAAECEIAPGTDLADRPSDSVSLLVPATAPAPPGSGEELHLRLALGRSLQLAGALEATREATVLHLRDRVQFGVPLARLPVVRDRIAVLAEETEIAVAAAEEAVAIVAAADAGSRSGLDATLAVGAAKVRTGEAAARGARIAHQLNGALGMTEEHVLHHFTRSLWAWCDRDGNEREWAIRVGKALAEGGGESLWPTLSGHS